MASSVPDSLITSWSNSGTAPYETLTTDGAVISSAINTSETGIVLTNTFALVAGVTYKFYYDATVNSGQNPFINRIPGSANIGTMSTGQGSVIVPVGTTGLFLLTTTASNFTGRFWLVPIDPIKQWKLHRIDIKPRKEQTS